MHAGLAHHGAPLLQPGVLPGAGEEAEAEVASILRRHSGPSPQLLKLRLLTPHTHAASTSPLSQVLEVATLSFFLITLDCQYFGTNNNFHNQEFPAVYCFAMPHLAHAAVAGGALVVFIGMALLFTMGEME